MKDTCRHPDLPHLMEGARMDPEMHGALVMVIPHPDIPILNILHQSAILLVLHTTIGITPKGNPTGTDNHPGRTPTQTIHLILMRNREEDTPLPTGPSMTLAVEAQVHFTNM